MSNLRAHMWRAGAAALTAVALAFSPAGASAFASTPAPSAEASANTLRIATNGFVDSFNPFTSYYAVPTTLFRYMYENLVQYDQETGAPTEGLAESWETSPDGKVWTFHIRQGMTWSDGEPITAADPAWTYQQMMDDEAMGAANGTLVAGFDSVETPDDNTLVITLKEAQAANPGVEIPVVPKHVWEKIDNPAEFANDSEPAVGSGPFTLESYAANQYIRLKANPNFWRGAPQIDNIEYVYYTNPDAQVQALRAGEVDMVGGLSGNEFANLENEDNITTVEGSGRRYTGLSLNPGAETPSGEAYGTGAEALKDVKVRQAIRQAIDIDSLRDNIMQGHGQKATSFIPAMWSDWALPEDDSVIVGYDPEAAKALLDEAGWKEGADGIREKDGEKLNLRLYIDGEDTNEPEMANFIGPWLKDIGINVDVQSSDSDTITEKVTKADYDMYFTGWGVGPDPDYQLSINTCASRPGTDGSGPTSQDLYCNPEFDRLYQQQHAELDHEKRVELVRQMLELHYTDAPSIAFWYPAALEAYRSDRFTDFGLQPTEGGSILGQQAYWGFYLAKPVEGGNAGSGVSTGLIVGGIAVVVIIAGGVIVAMRRKKTADDRA